MRNKHVWILNKYISLYLHHFILRNLSDNKLHNKMALSLKFYKYSVFTFVFVVFFCIHDTISFLLINHINLCLYHLGSECLCVGVFFVSVHWVSIRDTLWAFYYSPLIIFIYDIIIRGTSISFLPPDSFPLSSCINYLHFVNEKKEKKIKDIHIYSSYIVNIMPLLKSRIFFPYNNN